MRTIRAPQQRARGEVPEWSNGPDSTKPAEPVWTHERNECARRASRRRRRVKSGVLAPPGALMKEYNEWRGAGVVERA